MPGATYQFDLSNGHSYQINFDRALSDEEIGQVRSQIESGEIDLSGYDQPPKQPSQSSPAKSSGLSKLKQGVQNVASSALSFLTGGKRPGPSAPSAPSPPLAPNPLAPNPSTKGAKAITREQYEEQKVHPDPIKALTSPKPKPAAVDPMGRFKEATTANLDGYEPDYGDHVLEQVRRRYGSRLDPSHQQLIAQYARQTKTPLRTIYNMVSSGNYDAMRHEVLPSNITEPPDFTMEDYQRAIDMGDSVVRLKPGAAYEGHNYIPLDKAIETVRRIKGGDPLRSGATPEQIEGGFLRRASADPSTGLTPSEHGRDRFEQKLFQAHDPVHQAFLAANLDLLKLPGGVAHGLGAGAFTLAAAVGGNGSVSSDDLKKTYAILKKSPALGTVGYFVPIVGQVAFFSDIASSAAESAAKGTVDPLVDFGKGFAESLNIFQPGISLEERAVRGLNLVLSLAHAGHSFDSKITEPILARRLIDKYGLSAEEAHAAIGYAQEAVTRGYVPEKIRGKTAGDIYGSIRRFLTGPNAVTIGRDAMHASEQVIRERGESRWELKPDGRSLNKVPKPENQIAAPAPPSKIEPDQHYVNAEGFPFAEARMNPEKIGVLDGLQYKKAGIVDSKNAVTDELKGVAKYDQGTAGPLSIWQREDGSTWVINGHHRRELAIRTGEADVPVRIYKESDGIDFKTARAIGALQNIKDGKGTAIDAATVLRDLGASTDDLKGYGVNLKTGVGRDAVALLQLTPEALGYVEDGSVHEKVAAAIAEARLDPKKQIAAMRAADGLETRAQGEFIAAKAKDSTTVDTTGGTGDLFGDAPEEFAWKHQARIAEAAAKRLVSDQRLYNAVAKGKAVGDTAVDTEAQRRAAMIEETARGIIAYDPETAATLEREAITYAKEPRKAQFEQAVRRVTDKARTAAIRKLGELGQLEEGPANSDGGRGESGRAVPAEAAPTPRIELTTTPAESTPQMFSEGEARGERSGFDFDKSADPIESAKRRLRQKFGGSEDKSPIIREGTDKYGDESKPYKMRPTDGSPEIQKLGQDAIRDVRAKKTIFASAIADDLQSSNQVTLLGRKATSFADLATLAQVYRDPRFETIRYYFTKDGTIVGQNAFSARLPSSSPLFDEPHQTKLLVFLEQMLDQTGADGFWVQHNHPSGIPEPSGADIAVSKMLAMEMPGYFKGHLIIDSNKYGWITSDYDGNADYGVVTHYFGDDTLLRASKPHELLGFEINGPRDVAKIAATLKNDKGWSTIVAADAQLAVRGLADVPVSDLLQPNIQRAAATIRRIGRSLGSPQMILVVADADVPLVRENMDLVKMAVKTDLLVEVMSHSGVSLNPGVLPDRSNFGLGLPIERAKKVQEPQADYDVDHEAVSDLSALVEHYKAKTLEDFARNVREDIGDVPDHLLQRAWDNSVLSKAADARHAKTGLPTKERSGYSVDEFRQRIDAIQKIAKGGGANVFRDLQAMGVNGLFENPNRKWKFGRIRINDLSVDQFADTLAHEVGHQIDSVMSRAWREVNTPNAHLKTGASGKFNILFGTEDKPALETIKNELTAVTKALVGEQAFEDNPGYYSNKKELFARFMQSAMFHSSLIEDLAPTAYEHLMKMVSDHPILNDYMKVAQGAMVDKPQNFFFLPDTRQGYIKKLDRYLGTKAYGEEVLYRSRRAQAIVETEKLMDEKFKGIKDDPASLFDAAEGVLHTVGGNPQFGTKMYSHVDIDGIDPDLLDIAKQGMTTEKPDAEFKKAQAAVKEMEALRAAGYDEVGETNDGSILFEKWRKPPEEAEIAYKQLSPEGQALIREYTADLSEAKDIFNREKMKQVFKIDSDIEGYVHHFGFDDSEVTTWRKLFLTERKASATKQRGEVQGFKRDFRAATQKALTELRIADAYNEFISKQLAITAKPLEDGEKVAAGWVEIQGNTRQGFDLPGSRRIMLENGTKIAIGKRYQVPAEVYERYVKQRLYVDEVTTSQRVVNSLNRYWQGMILAHPGTAMTNFLSGGIQLGGKMLTDFYQDLFDAPQGNALDRTRANVMGVLETMTPSGWKGAPDWVYGSDKSNYYGQFIQGEGAMGPVDSVIDKALAGYQGIERFWKKAIINAEKRSSSSRDPLHDPEFIKSVNHVIDVWAYDYQNVPLWLENFRKHPVGGLVKPFMTYPYKYMKMLTDMAGGAFDKNLPPKERAAKVMALATIVTAYGMFKKAQREKQSVGITGKDVPETFDEAKLKSVVNTRGRLFLGKDNEGNEVFIRTAKYPFLNAYDLIESFVTGNGDVGQDILQDQLGTIGPLGKLIANNIFGMKGEFDQYKDDATVNADTVASAIPFGRVLKDVADAADPKQREFARDPSHVFGQFIPAGGGSVREQLAGGESTIKVPLTTEEKQMLTDRNYDDLVYSIRHSLGDAAANKMQSDINAAEEGKKRLTGFVELPIPKHREDVLYRLLGGVVLKRVNPEWYRRFYNHAVDIAKKRESKLKDMDETSSE